MRYTEKTKRAMNLCFDAHKNQFDKGGTPYVFHPYHLAEQFNDENLICVALLHDVLEDNPNYSINLIRDEFGSEISSAIEAITRKENEKYSDYIDRVSKNELARLVKVEDLLHNLNKKRIEECSEFTLEKRYLYAYYYLVLQYKIYDSFDTFIEKSNNANGFTYIQTQKDEKIDENSILVKIIEEANDFVKVEEFKNYGKKSLGVYTYESTYFSCYFTKLTVFFYKKIIHTFYKA